MIRIKVIGTMLKFHENLLSLKILALITVLMIWEWSNCIENTLKINYNNNLKEFQVLNIRNNLYFIFFKSKIQRLH